VPVTTSAGEWLEHRVAETPLVRDHTELGDTALWVALPVGVRALVIWWRQREATAAADTTAPAPRRTYLAPLLATVTRIVAVLAILVAGAAVYDTYRIGDSGAKASWTGNFSSTAG